jgi:ribosome-associated translation inhibitor RaiA
MIRPSYIPCDQRDESGENMQIDIQALSFALTDGLRRHIQRRLAFALGTRDEHIHRITVRLTDINGPKGGKDMCCHIQVTLKRLPSVVVKHTEADLYTAIGRAADRVGRSVIRKLGKQRTIDTNQKYLMQVFDEPLGDPV